MAQEATATPASPLHPVAIVTVWRHGHAAPASEDFERALSAKGRQQAAMLGNAEEDFFDDVECVICSAAPRAQQTAVIAMFPPGFGWSRSIPVWFSGFGRQFYSFADDAHHAAFIALSEVVNSTSYAAHKAADKNGLLAKLREELLATMFNVPHIDRAGRIDIFNHAVVGNALAEALFPQHAKAIEAIDLNPCDGIRLTATTCQHIPLMT